MTLTINLIYIFTVLIGCYFGITSYIRTKHKIILRGLGVLLLSLALEIQWLNIGNYITDTTDIFRTTRDIIRTILTIFFFGQVYMIGNQSRTEKDQTKTESDQIQTEKDQTKTESEQVKTEKNQTKTEKNQIQTEKDQKGTV